MRSMQRRNSALAVGLAFLLVATPIAPGGDPAIENEIFARSLVSAGDTVRVQKVLAAARRGDPVTVAVIGGSITQGALASKPENRYGERIARWWREKFPRSKVGFANAGIGATGSDYGAQRARRDLLRHHPDVVVVEYGVNDANTRACAETLEGLVRQILREPQAPAILLLFMMTDQGGNAQEWQSKVGRHYGLPMISYRDALWPEIQAGRMERKEIFPDTVHPNDRGHELAARFVTGFLEGVAAALPPNGSLPAPKPLPSPLFTDLFENTRIHDAGDLPPLRNDGWTLDAKEKCWRADRPGSMLELEVEGRLVFVQSLRLHAAMGRARIQVDDRPAVTLEGWFDQTWGGWRRTDIAARDLPPGKHRVRIELLEEKHPESAGHEFKVYELGAAGVER